MYLVIESEDVKKRWRLNKCLAFSPISHTSYTNNICLFPSVYDWLRKGQKGNEGKNKSNLKGKKRKPNKREKIMNNKKSPQVCHFQLNLQKIMSHSAERSDSCSDIFSVVSNKLSVCCWLWFPGFSPLATRAFNIAETTAGNSRLSTANTAGTAKTLQAPSTMKEHSPHISPSLRLYSVKQTENRLKKRWSAVKNAEQIGFL